MKDSSIGLTFFLILSGLIMDVNYYNFNFIPKNFLKGLSLSNNWSNGIFDI